ncbi:hypothetical protein F5880DRAFT_1511457 [Lentinula raphanica]|nr:hypothetical protein F5880DRAFT_1511457 [Lentinula raphanica]
MDIESTGDMSESHTPATTSVSAYPIGSAVLENESETIATTPDGVPSNPQHAPPSSMAPLPAPENQTAEWSPHHASEASHVPNPPNVYDPPNGPDPPNIPNPLNVSEPPIVRDPPNISNSSNDLEPPIVANTADVITSSNVPESVDRSDTLRTPDTVIPQIVVGKRSAGPIDANTDIARFFDLEAQVDSDNEEYESKAEEDDFIDDQETVSSHSPGPNVIAQTTPRSAFLEHLEETYLLRELRHSSPSSEPPTILTQLDKIRLNNAEDWISQKLRRSVQIDDWKLYRVKCLPNTEVDVIHYLLSEKDLRNELRAPFYNHDIIGAVYLEACFSCNPIHGKSLLDTLSGLVDVRLNTLCVVPECDYSSSLSPKSSSLSHRFYSTGDWVTVGHGLYKGDVGLVMGYVETLGTGKHNIGILLVPRLVMNFDADKDEFEQTHKHRILGYFSHGLTLRYYTPTSLTPATAIPHELMDLFVKSKHPVFAQAPLLQPDTWQFFPGKKVSSNEFGGITGRIRVVTERGCEVESKEGLHHIPMLQLRKVIHPGDYIRVLHGTHKDLTGLVGSVTARLVGLIPDSGIRPTSRAQFFPGKKVSSNEFGGITGRIRVVTERGCEVESEEGLHHIPMLQLRKVIHPGDYIRVLHGTHKDLTGLVGSVTARLVGLIPDSEYSKTISNWVDVNTVTLTDSSRLVHHFPWENVQVRILGGLFQGMKAVIKNVWPDGHGSLQVSLFIPAIHHSCEVDYTEIVEYSLQKSLQAFALIPGYLSHFLPNRDLEAMKTGKKPWIGARGNIVSGPWKGYRGIVSHGASGVKLLVELNVVTPTVTNPRHHIDYDHVRETRPTERQSFFMPSSSYIPLKPESTSSQYLQTVKARTGTPEPDELARTLTFTGLWHPQWDFHDQRSKSIFRQPADYFRSIAQGGSDVAAPNLNENIWIFHSKLVGIAMQVALKGRKGTHYVKVMPRQGGGFMVIEERSKGGEPVVVWTPDVSRSQDRPKPKTEKSLMVIVKGPEEHIGKLVRRIHHFYKGTKSEDTLWFVLGVVEFLPETGEILTSERLENHPDDLEKVQESRDVRQRSAHVMAAARDEFRFSSPEIRLYSLGRAIWVIHAHQIAMSTPPRFPDRSLSNQVDQGGGPAGSMSTNAQTLSNTSILEADSTIDRKPGRISSFSQAQQNEIRARFPQLEEQLLKHKLHLGKPAAHGSRARDPEPLATWINDTVKEIKALPAFGLVNDTTNHVDRIIKEMFKNYRNNTFIKRNKAAMVQEAIANKTETPTMSAMEASKAADALISFKTPAPAKEIFRKKHLEEIREESFRLRAEAAQNREALGVAAEEVDLRRNDNGGAYFQKALSDLWQKADQEHYQKMVNNDRFTNQQKFNAAMKTALSTICQSGALGPVEMVLLSGSRNKENQVAAEAVILMHSKWITVHGCYA